MRVELFNNQKNIKINKGQVKNITVKFLKHLRQPQNCMLNIFFVSAGKITKINKQLLKRPQVTDVIAIETGKFTRDIYSNYLGDIIICPQKAKQNCKIFNTSFLEEIALYVAHGILHLLNYDDLKAKDRIRMEKKQKELMGLI